MTKLRPGTMVLALTLTLASAEMLHAESRANERIALALSGEKCSLHHQAIARGLSGVPGVIRIDMNLIADHVLIDRVQDQRTSEDFLTLVNGLIPSDGQCRAEVMESCISADPTPPRHSH